MPRNTYELLLTLPVGGAMPTETEFTAREHFLQRMLNRYDAVSIGGGVGGGVVQEQWRFAHLQTATAARDELTQQAAVAGLDMTLRLLKMTWMNEDDLMAIEEL